MLIRPRAAFPDEATSAMDEGLEFALELAGCGRWSYG